MMAFGSITRWIPTALYELEARNASTRPAIVSQCRTAKVTIGRKSETSRIRSDDSPVRRSSAALVVGVRMSDIADKCPERSKLENLCYGYEEIEARIGVHSNQNE